MNCLAFSSHIAGTVITQCMSSSTAPSPRMICSASRVVKSSLNPCMMKAKILRAFWGFPFTSCRMRSRDIYWKKTVFINHTIHDLILLESNTVYIPLLYDLLASILQRVRILIDTSCYMYMYVLIRVPSTDKIKIKPGGCRASSWSSGNRTIAAALPPAGSWCSGIRRRTRCCEVHR